jgi:hypothetical protein
MNSPFRFPVNVGKAAFFLSVTAWAVSCRQQPIQVLDYAQAKRLTTKYVSQYKPGKMPAYWVGPSTTYTRLRRAKSAEDAIIAGHVDEREENGTLRPSPGAIISIDRGHVFADENGNYAQAVTPGRHTLRIGWVGMLWSEAEPLRAQAGDSIRTSSQLLHDPRPLMN